MIYDEEEEKEYNNSVCCHMAKVDFAMQIRRCRLTQSWDCCHFTGKFSGAVHIGVTYNIECQCQCQSYIFIAPIVESRL